MTQQLVDVLYVISSALLVPTLFALLALTASMLIATGSVLREVFERYAMASRRKALQASLQAGGSVDRFYEGHWNGFADEFQRKTHLIKNYPLLIGKCVDDLELEITRRLGRLAFAARVGPMLGLIGTLIPLGPALTGLASGDVQTLSSNLVVAFTTTVVGVLVGGMGYTLSLIRRGWYERDLNDLEFVSQLLIQTASGSEHFSDSAQRQERKSCSHVAEVRPDYPVQQLSREARQIHEN